MKKYLVALVLLPALAFAEAPATEQALNMQQLLQQMQKQQSVSNRENKQREQQFLQSKQQQEKMLADIRQQQKEQETRSSELEKQFEANDKKISDEQAILRERLGSLSELFGNITSAAGDARSNFDKSLVSAQYPGREAFLEQLIKVASSGTELPSIEQIEKLSFELLREMAEQGHVVKFKADVTAVAGGVKQQDVVRVGVFNAFTLDGQYLAFQNNHLRVLPRQPGGKYTGEAEDFAALTQGFGKVGIDPTGPTGGSLLSALIETPNIIERWQQGGLVGYIISVIGVFALLLAIWRVLVLTRLSGKVARQLKDKTAHQDNPLGRVLAAAQQYQGADLETLELKINEAIIKELPSLQSGEAILKIVAAVAPLLGLLGTVTGMIITFQAITIYGSGDPTAMAGGISTALVTTVQGLVVAIPTVLMHTLISGRSRRIIHVLEEQAAGIVARHQEAQ